MTITAKFDGICNACKGKIRKGERIEWCKGYGSRHVDNCATPRATARPWNDGGTCPTCKVTWMSAAYVRKGYQCDSCADRDEGKSFGVEY